jgi:hypothetical protein
MRDCHHKRPADVAAHLRSHHRFGDLHEPSASHADRVMTLADSTAELRLGWPYALAIAAGGQPRSGPVAISLSGVQAVLRQVERTDPSWGGQRPEAPAWYCSATLAGIRPRLLSPEMIV